MTEQEAMNRILRAQAEPEFRTLVDAIESGDAEAINAALWALPTRPADPAVASALRQAISELPRAVVPWTYREPRDV